MHVRSWPVRTLATGLFAALFGCSSGAVTPVAPTSARDAVASTRSPGAPRPTDYTVVATSGQFSNAASLPVLTVVAGGAPASFYVVGPDGQIPDYTVAQENAGTAACPTNAIAMLNEYQVPTEKTLGPPHFLPTVAGNAPGSCDLTISIVDATRPGSLQLRVIVLRPHAGLPSGTLVGASGSTVTFWDLSTGAVEKTVQIHGTVTGIARNAAGDLYVAGYTAAGQGAIEELPPNATSDADRIAIVGAQGAGPLALDASGNVYTTLCCNNDEPAAVAEYPPNLNGQTALLSGTATMLGDPNGLYVDPSGNVFVCAYTGPDITVAIDGFPPLRPGTNDIAPVSETVIATGVNFVAQTFASLTPNGAGGVFYAINNALGEVSSAGAAATELPSNVGGIGGIAAHGNRVYFSENQYGGEADTGAPVIEYDQLANPNAGPVPFISAGALMVQMLAY